MVRFACDRCRCRDGAGRVSDLVVIAPGDADQPRPGYYPKRDDPSPQEIAEACRRIQESWSPAEKERRVVGPKRTDPVVTPIVRVCDIVLE